ncbi:MAG: hypothetical protein IIY21_03510 [Clostridiales bacterium]|nr:hypothetical protein [Clostridiales bacterium]
MSNKPCDVKVGDRFGRLLVIERAPNVGRNTAWKCICDCGNETIVRGIYLVRHATQSCGCLRKTSPKKRQTIILGCKHPLYRKWVNMKSRCYNSNVHDYENYGARGITICEEWLHDPNAFILWSLANGWKDGLQIDRIDNDKGYSPKNCRFVTLLENKANQRKKHVHNGEKREVIAG